MRRQKRTPAWRRLTLIVMALSLILAACGGNGDGAGEEATDGAAGDGETAAEGGDGTEPEGEPVVLANVCGFSGAAATVCEMWGRGIDMAVQDINDAGGILGRPVEAFREDTQSEPPQSVAAMERALGQDPYVVMGTVFSSSTIVNMETLAEAGVPQFVGAESPNITLEEEPTHLFRTSANGAQQFDAMQLWMEESLQPETMSIMYVNNEFGQGGLDALLPRLEEAGITVEQQISTEVGQGDFTGELTRVQQANPDALFLYMHEEETGRLLRAMQQAGVEIPIVGATTALADSTIELAGDAADGVRGLATYTGKAEPFQELAQRAREAHGETMDHNFYKAYVGVWAVKYATEEIGELDQQGLIDFMHGRAFCVSDYPNLFADTWWDEFGDIHRETYIVEIQGGEQQLVEAVPAPEAGPLSECG